YFFFAKRKRKELSFVASSIRRCPSSSPSLPSRPSVPNSEPKSPSLSVPFLIISELVVSIVQTRPAHFFLNRRFPGLAQIRHRPFRRNVPRVHRKRRLVRNDPDHLRLDFGLFRRGDDLRHLLRV